MKRFSVIIDNDAEEDLFEIYSFLALHESEERAITVTTALKDTCLSLTTLPLRGHIPPELFAIGVVEFREVHFKPYRVIYSVEKSTVFIHCVLDGRRDMQTLLHERLLR